MFFSVWTESSYRVCQIFSGWPVPCNRFSRWVYWSVEFYNRKNQKRFEIPSSGRGLLIEQLNKCCFLSLCYDFFFIRSANFFYKYCITFIICYWSNVCHGICSLTFILFDRPFWIFKTMIDPCHGIKVFTPICFVEVYVLLILFVFIYVCWLPPWLPYQMRFVSLNSNTSGFTSGSGTVNSSQAPEFTSSF